MFHAYAKAEDFAQEFEQVFGERSDHVLEYLHHAQKVFELTEEVFLRNPLRKAWRYAWLRSSKSGFIETLKGFYNIKHPSQKVFY